MKQLLNAFNVQSVLQWSGFYKGDVDGDIGPKSLAAIERVMAKHSKLPDGWSKWPVERKAVAALQVVLKVSGFALMVGPIDGYAGSSTANAFSSWDIKQRTGRLPKAWRPDDVKQLVGSPIKVIGNNWGVQSEMTRRFGDPGGEQCTAGVVNLPFKMKLAWDTSEIITKIHCHEKVAQSVERCYRRVYSAYSTTQIYEMGFDLFGGCFAMRNKRGGKTLSTHAWGVAIDHDPLRNQLKWNHSRANLATLAAIEFWRIWESEGWTSLGRVRDFDWMHVQAPGI